MDIFLDSKSVLSTEAVWFDNLNIWFSSMLFNGLYKYDISTQQTHFIGSFPKEKRNEWRLHGKALKIDHEIFFLPNRSKYIHVYDIERHQIYSYDMKTKERINCKNAIYYKGCIYFVGNDSEITLYEMNAKTKKIKKYPINIKDYKGQICADYIVIDTKFYFACDSENIVIEYNMDSNTYCLHRVFKGSKGFGSIAYDGNSFLLSDSESVFRWNKDTDIVQEIYDDFPTGYGMTVKDGDAVVSCTGFTNKYNKNEKPFWFSAVIADYLWLFPFRTNMIIKMNLSNGKMFEVPLLDEKENDISLFMKTRMTHCHYVGGRQGERILFSSTKTRRMYVLENDGCINTDYFSFLAEEPKNFEIYYCNDVPVFTESKKENLKKFINIIMSDNRLEGKNYYINSMGNNIFKFMRSI